MEHQKSIPVTDLLLCLVEGRGFDARLTSITGFIVDPGFNPNSRKINFGKFSLDLDRYHHGPRRTKT
jgi:hypothetical protein